LDRNYYRYLSTNQISRQFWQSVQLTLSEAVFDLEVAALDVACFTEALPDSVEQERIKPGAAEQADCRFLRTRRERPRGRPTEKKDEIAPRIAHPTLHGS